MTTALIKKDNVMKAYKYMIRANHYRYFPQSVTTAEDMITFLTKDGTDEPKLQFMDDKNHPYKHFSVRKIGDFYSAVIDMDESKKMMFSDNELFPKEDRRKFFSETDQDIPLTSEKDLLEYAEEKYPALVDLYHKIFAEKTDKHSVKSFIESHSEKYFSQPAMVDFE